MRPVVIASLLSGCLAADPTTSSQDQADTVITEAAPRAYCPSCGDGHVVGEPVTVLSSFYGVCDGQFGDYECMRQDYTLSVTCTQGSCTSPAAVSLHGKGSVLVTPLSTGTTQLVATLAATSCIDDGYGEDICTTTNTPFALPVTSYVPDRITVTCVAGPNWVPCVAGPNPQPVALTFSLWAGSQALRPARAFTVSASSGGTLYDNNHWLSDGPSHVTRVSYGGLVQALDIRVGMPADRLDDGAAAMATEAYEP